MKTKAHVAATDEIDLFQASNTDSQIIDQTIQMKLSDQFRPYILISGMLLLFTLLEWYRWLEQLPPVPILMSGLFIFSVVIAFVKQRQFHQEIGFLSYGKKGEKSISYYLKNLINSSNARVFKNVKIYENTYKYIVSAKFGLMIIDVIDLQPPENGEANVVYKNNNLTLNGYPMDRNPVEDMKNSCDILQNTLQLSSNKMFSVYGVVVFPNWYVKQHGNSVIRIINPRQLPEVYKNIYRNTTIDEQCLASYHLGKYIRSIA